MAKPIFLVELPISTNEEEVIGIQSMLESKMTDYYSIVYRSRSSYDIDFKVFYEKDFDEIKYEELKEMVRSNLNNGN
jgi:hypothetical protein